MGNNIGAVVTDLDGTLLTDDKQVGDADLEALHKLGDKGILRIAATGRNLRISEDVLPDEFPLDYLVFSTGCGIYDWKKKKIIHSDGLDWKQTQKVMKQFMAEEFDFTVHQPIPDNYRFYYHRQNPANHHFNEYVDRYSSFAEPLEHHEFQIDNACQLLAIIETDTKKYNDLINQLEDVKLVRTTSPLNGEAMWIEVFPRHISKAWGLKYIEKTYGVPFDNMLGIGNDYNDIDFLREVGHPRVVANAHPDLLKQFPIVASNQSCGVAEAIKTVVDF